MYLKGEQFYEGKAKRLFRVVDHPELIWQDFKNSLTALNGRKLGEFEGKGQINAEITHMIYSHLSQLGLRTHFVQMLSDHEMVTMSLKMLKVEVVVRNRLAGSTANKFNIAEGTHLEKPLVEFYYKDDDLSDPFISDDQALMLKVVNTQAELEKLKETARKVNKGLQGLFASIGIELIDFKIEFGQTEDGEIVLADEITPDTCRLWAIGTEEKMDKDRFRRDMGAVKENYEKVFHLLRQSQEKK